MTAANMFYSFMGHPDRNSVNGFHYNHYIIPLKMKIPLFTAISIICVERPRSNVKGGRFKLGVKNTYRRGVAWDKGFTDFYCYWQLVRGTCARLE